MNTLWTSDAAAWVDALSPSSIDNARNTITKMKKDFESLDQMYQEMRDAVMKREPPHLRKPELVTLVDWKLNRGKWRPRLLDYAKAHIEEDVITSSTEAFKNLPALATDDGLTTALKALCSLKGIGPATASAALALVSPHCPFMSDESLNLTATKRDYTAKSYIILRAKLTAKAEELSKESGNKWTAVMVEQALWVSCYRLEEDEAPARKKTRK